MAQLSSSLRVAPDKLLNLSMFSHQSANKKQSSSAYNRCHMITSKSTSFEDLAKYSASDSKKIPPKRNLNSCKCDSFFPTPHKYQSLKKNIKKSILCSVKYSILRYFLSVLKIYIMIETNAKIWVDYCQKNDLKKKKKKKRKMVIEP